MGRIILSVLILAGALVAGGPAEAQSEAPWCLKAQTGRSVRDICRFKTFDACNSERALYGSTSWCIQNSRYFPGQDRGKSAVDTHRKKRHRP